MASMTRKKKILIVEDDAGSRKLMSILLSRSPYEIITATNGIEAFERVRTDAPVDLILMDLGLPGLTGGAVIRQLKNDPSTSAIPVIVTTSSDRESPLVQEALDAGASRILYKPTPMNVLTVEVNRYLSSDVT
jgi:two-component system cell cycle response regulator